MEKLFDKIVGGEFTGFCDARLGDQGLKPLQFLYAEYWRGADGRIDFDRVEREVPRLAGTLLNDMLCIDVEGKEWGGLHPGTGDRTKWQQDNDEIKRLIDVLRRLLTDVKLSLFASCPSLHEWSMNGFHGSRNENNQGKVWRRWLLATEFMHFQRGLADYLDYYSPSFYWKVGHWLFTHKQALQWGFTDAWNHVSPLYEQQRESTLQSWITITLHSLQHAGDLLPKKPMIPCLSTQWWTQMGSDPDETAQDWAKRSFDSPRRGELVYPSWVLAALDAIKPFCDSVAFWLSPDSVGGFAPEHYFASQGWRSIRENLVVH